MCFECHLNLSDNFILQSLQDNHDFIKWNSTSINHLIMSSSGFNGSKNRYLSLNLLIKYYAWNNKNLKQTYMKQIELEQTIRYLLHNSLTVKNPQLLTNYLTKLNI